MQDKPYFTYEETMEVLGVSRSTLFSMIKDLDIQYHKFKYDKRRYLAAADVERLKQIREEPWRAGEDKPEKSVA